MFFLLYVFETLLLTHCLVEKEQTDFENPLLIFARKIKELHYGSHSVTIQLDLRSMSLSKIYVLEKEVCAALKTARNKTIER